MSMKRFSHVSPTTEVVAGQLHADQITDTASLDKPLKASVGPNFPFFSYFDGVIQKLVEELPGCGFIRGRVSPQSQRLLCNNKRHMPNLIFSESSVEILQEDQTIVEGEKR